SGAGFQAKAGPSTSCQRPGAWGRSNTASDVGLVLIVVVVVVVVVVIVLFVCAHRLQAAEEAVAFACGTGREIELAGNSSAAAVSMGERPKTLNNHGLSGLAFEEAFEAALLVKRHDRAASEVADQELVGVLAERARREGHAPGRVNRPKPSARVRSGDEAVEPLGLKIKHVNQ